MTIRAKNGPESDSERQRREKAIKIVSGTVFGHTFVLRLAFRQLHVLQAVEILLLIFNSNAWAKMSRCLLLQNQTLAAHAMLVTIANIDIAAIDLQQNCF